MSELPFGIDVSRYDGLLDYKKVAEHKPPILFIAFRATISWGYRDPFFVANWVAAGDLGIGRLGYHVVYPAEDETRQVDNLFAQIEKVFNADHDRLVLDVELEQGMHDIPKARYTRVVRRMADIIKVRTGRLPVLYSRAEFIDRRLSYDELGDLDLWLAQYLRAPEGAKYTAEHPGPPALPKGAKTWLIHQTGDKLPNICATSGKVCQDYNRWNGTVEDVQRYFNFKRQSRSLDDLESWLLEIEQRIAWIENVLGLR